MAIKVQCSCGKAFAAKDELADKTVKCPGCQKPLKIPGGTAPAKAAKPEAAAKPEPAKKAAAKSGDDDDYSLSAEEPAPRPKSDLFAEVGLKAAPKGTMPCPGCMAPLPQDAVVCVKCGYNMKLGRKMKTLSTGGASHGEAGHGVVAQDLMDRAAETLEGDEEAEESKGKEGMPWWVYLIILIVLIAIAAYMLNRGGGEESKDGKKAILTPSGQLILPA
jgi:ribosomal protein L40E